MLSITVSMWILAIAVIAMALAVYSFWKICGSRRLNARGITATSELMANEVGENEARITGELVAAAGGELAAVGERLGGTEGDSQAIERLVAVAEASAESQSGDLVMSRLRLSVCQRMQFWLSFDSGK